MRRAYSSLWDGGDAWELPALEQLEGGSAARGDPRDSACDARVVHGPDRIAAADDGVAVALGQGTGDGEAAFGEARPFEDAHRTVPEHRLCARDLRGELRTRARADVEPQPPFRQRVERDHLDCCVGVERVGGDDVDREDRLEREGIL